MQDTGMTACSAQRGGDEVTGCLQSNNNSHMYQDEIYKKSKRQANKNNPMFCYDLAKRQEELIQEQQQQP